ncbi:MAG: ABC transporter ATP-binding protein [Patescibacteria group bacterium]
MISLSRLTKKFGHKTAVKDFTFSAKKGEIIGFLGPNGAGKTTTMRLILGYLSPSSGTIIVNGLNPGRERVQMLQKIGYLPENNPLYPEMKVIEYLRFVSSLKKEEDLTTVIDSVGLNDVYDEKIDELSRGYKQRVGLAAALCGNPDILILDEPTSGLDPLEQKKIRDLIKRLSKYKTILFSTHILSEIEDVAGRVIIINKGEKIYDGIKPKQKGGVEQLFRRIVRDS